MQVYHAGISCSYIHKNFKKGSKNYDSTRELFNNDERNVG